MTNEQTQMDPNFDYNTWREQGQNAVNALLARKESLELELSDVTAQIKEVRKTIGSKKDGPQRFRIKPLITKALVGKTTMEIKDIIAAIQAEKAGASQEQILSALNRYVNEFDKVTVRGTAVHVG